MENLRQGASNEASPWASREQALERYKERYFAQEKSASEVSDLLQLSNAGINLRVEDLNGTSQEFEERMESSQLSDEQIMICKQVRQRSKNRESARRYKR